MPGSTACLRMCSSTAKATLQTHERSAPANIGEQEGTMRSSPMAAGLWDALWVPVAGPSRGAQLDGLQH